MKLIGKGAFTKAYLNVNNEVILKSIDPIKEVMSLGWFPDHELFPKVSKVDHELYSMEYYPRVSSLKNNLDADQWFMYKELRHISDKVFNSINIHDSYKHIYEAFELIENEDLKGIMLEALDACSNIGSAIGFEISPRNVAVKNGKLILLDCFYCKETLRKIREK